MRQPEVLTSLICGWLGLFALNPYLDIPSVGMRLGQSQLRQLKIVVGRIENIAFVFSDISFKILLTVACERLEGSDKQYSVEIDIGLSASWCPDMLCLIETKEIESTELAYAR
jgi:hypothetical protein